MSMTAILLVLVSAFMHAGWNFLSKRSGGGLPFIWLFTAIGTAIYTPVVCMFLMYQQFELKAIHFVYIAGSIGLHLLYLVVLQRGYKKGDFSLVYPVARGLAPMIVTIVAMVLFHEQPSGIALTGTALIVGSVFLLTGGLRIFHDSKAALAIRYGAALGMIIASYTVWDTYVVSIILIPPLLLDYFTTLGRFILLTPVAIRNWADVRREWQIHRLEAVGIGIFNSLAYILVLTALVFAPVSYVAPIREISILIGTVLGIYVLRESYGMRRIVAAGSMVLGVVAVILG